MRPLKHAIGLQFCDEVTIHLCLNLQLIDVGTVGFSCLQQVVDVGAVRVRTFKQGLNPLLQVIALWLIGHASTDCPL